MPTNRCSTEKKNYIVLVGNVSCLIEIPTFYNTHFYLSCQENKIVLNNLTSWGNTTLCAHDQTHTNLLVISVARVTCDREVLQQVNAVVFIIPTEPSFQQSLPMIVIPVTQEHPEASIWFIKSVQTSTAQTMSKALESAGRIIRTAVFVRTKLSPVGHSGRHKLPESTWTALLLPLHCPSFYLKVSEGKTKTTLCISGTPLPKRLIDNPMKQQIVIVTCWCKKEIKRWEIRQTQHSL